MSNPRGVPYSPKRDAGMPRRNMDDPYRHAAKPPEPTMCPVCKAVFAIRKHRKRALVTRDRREGKRRWVMGC